MFGIDYDLEFAPGISFRDLDVSGGPGIVDHYSSRIEGYYLCPAYTLFEEPDSAFASGVLLVTCLDALSVLEMPLEERRRDQQKRYKGFIHDFLPTVFPDGSFEDQFVDHFRNGLIHEGRVKNGSMFSYEEEKPIQEQDGVLVADCRLLHKEIMESLKTLWAGYRADESRRSDLVKVTKEAFSWELKTLKNKYIY